MSLLAAKKDKEKEKEKEKDKKEKEKSSKDEDDEVKALLKAGTWKEVKDAQGRTYYVNPATKKSTWDLKKELKKEREAAAAAATSSTAPSPAAVAAVPQAAQSTNAVPVTSSASLAATPSPAVPSSTGSDALLPSGSAAGYGSNAPTNYSSGAVQYGINLAPSASAASPSIAAAGNTYGSLYSGPSGTSSSASAVPTAVTDPMQRLLDDNAQLRQLLASGSQGSVALDFQAKYDAVLRTNQALTVQTERMKQEYDAMARALTDANKKIHELQLTATSTSGGLKESTKDQEIQLTLSHLREQNRALVTQISELTTLLARGLNENAITAAMRTSSMRQTEEAGAALFSRFLDSSARQVLCPTCVLAVSQMRDRLLTSGESNVGARLNQSSMRGLGMGMGREDAAAPMYTQVPDITTPPSSYHYSDPKATAGGSYRPPEGVSGTGFGTPYQYGVAPSVRVYNPSTQSETPAVMYNGFVIKNPNPSGRPV
jgi:hypothetical protein